VLWKPVGNLDLFIYYIVFYVFIFHKRN